MKNRAVKSQTHEILPGDKISLVDVDEVIDWLKDSPNTETVDQLYDFGKLLLDQIRSLRDSYDSKLSSCLGWSTTLLAVMLVGGKEWLTTQGAVRYLASYGLLCAFISVVAAAIGLKSIGGWKWPSENDWFDRDYLKWPHNLKIQHLVQMLEAHQSYSKRTQRKGYALSASEYFLIFAAVLIGFSVFWRYF